MNERRTPFLCLRTILATVSTLAVIPLQAQTTIWEDDFTQVGSQPASLVLEADGMTGEFLTVPGSSLERRYQTYVVPSPPESGKVNVLVSAEQNAVGSNPGIKLTDVKGNGIASAGIAVTFPAGPVSAEELKKWKISFDYVSAFTANPLAITTVALRGASPNTNPWINSPEMALASETVDSYSFTLGELDQKSLDTLAAQINETSNSGMVMLQINFTGQGDKQAVDEGASVAISNIKVVRLP